MLTPDPPPHPRTQVHSTDVHVTTDVVHEEHHRAREYREGDHMRIWIDQDAHMSLVHVHEFHTLRSPSHGVLTDYTKGYEWRWTWSNETVKNCVLMKEQREEKPHCLSNGNLTHSFNIGENLKVDNYNQVVVVHDKGLRMDIDTVVEAGSTSVPVAEFIVGMVDTPDKGKVFFHDKVDFFNFSEDPIDAKVFEVPAECPL